MTAGAPGLYGSGSNDYDGYTRCQKEYCYDGCTGASTGVQLARNDTVRIGEGGA